MVQTPNSIKAQIDTIANTGRQSLFHYDCDQNIRTLFDSYENTLHHLENLSKQIDRGLCNQCGSLLEDYDYIEERICKTCMKHMAQRNKGELL